MKEADWAQFFASKAGRSLVWKAPLAVFVFGFSFSLGADIAKYYTATDDEK